MRSWRFSCLILSVLVLGCNQNADPNRPKTAPVSGTVTHKGQAVDGATVMFVSSSGSGRGAVGKTDAQGRFSMTTFQANDGAIPGSYRVAISKTTLEAPAEKTAPKPGVEPDTGTVKQLLPEKYKDSTKSGLTAEIKEGGVKDLKFELTD